MEFANKATSKADMYLVSAGSKSARAAANRRPLELDIAVFTRSPPKTAARISGTSTIASTFHRTGQLLSDQAGGRLAGAPPAADTSANSVGAASAGVAGRLNMVMWSQRRD